MSIRAIYCKFMLKRKAAAVAKAFDRLWISETYWICSFIL